MPVEQPVELAEPQPVLAVLHFALVEPQPVLAELHCCSVVLDWTKHSAELDLQLVVLDLQQIGPVVQPVVQIAQHFVPPVVQIAEQPVDFHFVELVELAVQPVLRFVHFEPLLELAEQPVELAVQPVVQPVDFHFVELVVLAEQPVELAVQQFVLPVEQFALLVQLAVQRNYCHSGLIVEQIVRLAELLVMPVVQLLGLAVRPVELVVQLAAVDHSVDH